MCISSAISLITSMLVHDLLSLTFFFISHPIHFAYLLFFSPYLFSLLSFLSPLLISSTLLSLLSLVSISPYLINNSSPLPLEFEFLGKTCGVALNLLRSVPGPRRENGIGMLDELDGMIIAPITQALVGNNEISVVRVEEIIGELCNSVSTNIVCEVESKGAEGMGETMLHDANLENSMHNQYGKFNDSSCLDYEEDGYDQEMLLVQSNCEEKSANDVIISDNYTQVRNYMGANYVLNKELVFSSENCVYNEKKEPKISASLDNSITKDSISVGTDMPSGEIFGGIGSEYYDSCTSDTEIKESESKEKDPSNLNFKDSDIINGEDQSVPKHTKESLVCNATEEGTTRSISIIDRRDHARTPSQCLPRERSVKLEREWKRTLACKLYEERITYKLREERSVSVPVLVTEGNGEEEEEMDMLWEAIEVSSNKSDCDTLSIKSKGKKEVERDQEESEYYETEGEEEGAVRHLCCLQAFRVSTRKMNLQVGSRNFTKLSKVFRNLSVFHVSRNSAKKSEEKKKKFGVIKG